MDQVSLQREKFESAVMRSALALLAEPVLLFARGADDDYRNTTIQAAWWAWQVSAAQETPLIKACQFLLKADSQPGGGETGAFRDGINWVISETKELNSK